MPKTAVDAPITTRAARDRLEARHEPYWRSIEAGAGVGYRKGKSGGTWMIRYLHRPGPYLKASLGAADDILPANGIDVLDFRQAQAAAVAWISEAQRRIAAGLTAKNDDPEPPPPKPPYTVAQAMSDYLADLEARGGKSVKSTRQTIDAHVVPVLGTLTVAALTRQDVKGWLRKLAASPRRVRSRPGQVRTRPLDPLDEDAKRRRRSSANRVFTNLKAALNLARAEGHYIGSDEAWAAVKPFRGVDSATIRYLHDPEILRLLNASDEDLGRLVTGALVTGCRYSELGAMRVNAFDANAHTIHVPISKGGKARHVALTEEGVSFFRQITAGRPPRALMFQHDVVPHAGGKGARKQGPRRGAWGHGHQTRPIEEACRAANIEPAITFHILRHTYGSRLAMKGAPMGVIAAQLGHADTRTTERHYAHLSPGYVAGVVRETFSAIGFDLPNVNVIPQLGGRG